MRSLSAKDLIQVWETGRNLSSVEKALTLLRADNPEISSDELEALSIGNRDSLLLDFRERAFGEAFHASVACPNCNEKLEFVMDEKDIRAAPRAENGKLTFKLLADGFDVQFRLPNSQDLSAVINAESAPIIRRLLVKRCALKVQRDQVPQPPEELPEEVVEKLSNQMAAFDPQADILLDLVCPACDHRWHLTFDIVSYLWSEISAQAKHLLGEVHLLACSYGWAETDILSMSDTRRASYLELLT